MDYEHHIKIGPIGLRIKTMPTQVDASQFYECVVCSKRMIFRTSPCIRRCGDAYVCSEVCGKARLNRLMEVDPKLTTPASWSSIKCDTLFNSDVVSNGCVNNGLSSFARRDSFSIENIKAAHARELRYVDETMRILPDVSDPVEDDFEPDFVFMDISSESFTNGIPTVPIPEKRRPLEKPEKLGCSRCIMYGASLFCMVCLMIVSYMK